MSRNRNPAALSLEEINKKINNLKSFNEIVANIKSAADKDSFKIFEPFGINKENLGENQQGLKAAYKQLSLKLHPDKAKNKEDAEAWTKLNAAYKDLNDQLNKANFFAPNADASSAASGGVPTYNVNAPFNLNDIVDEFKKFSKEDYEKNHPGEKYSEDKAKEAGYSYEMSPDGHSLTVTCPDSQSRNAFIQQLDRQLMISPATPALKDSKDSSEDKQLAESEASSHRSPGGNPTDLPTPSPDK